MIRKIVVLLLSLVLLVSLVGVAFSTSSNVAFTHPDKLEGWLNQSKFYDHFVAMVAGETEKVVGGNGQSGPASPGDTAIRQAATIAFPPQILQQNINTLLNSNYSWLEGKTSHPDFMIDLTAAKQSFAAQIGQLVEIRLAGLPACSNAQLAQLGTNQNIDYLTITCRPPSLTPQAAAAQATQQINSGGSLLANPVITASSINPKGNNNSGQPYYQKLSMAPKLYRLGLKLPWFLGGLALLSTLGIVFLAPRKRKGVRRVSVVLLEAGVILVAVKFVADTAFNQLKKHIFNSSSVGQLQQSLTDFLHRVEAQLVKVDLWFGIAFLALALLLFGILWFTRQKSGTPAKPDAAGGAETPQAGNTPAFPELKQPPRPKRPRLIQ
jgi:hypothetical protein